MYLLDEGEHTEQIHTENLWQQSAITVTTDPNRSPKANVFWNFLGPLWQFKVASLMMELLQQWEKLSAIKLKNTYFSSPRITHQHFDYHSTRKGCFNLKLFKGLPGMPLSVISPLYKTGEESIALLRARKVCYCVIYSQGTKQRDTWKMSKRIQDQKH